MDYKTYFEELEKYAKENHVPIIRSKSLELLEKEVAAKKPERILEIGTAIGYSGSKMLLSSPNSKLYTIEIDPERCNLARENFKKAGLYDRVVLWEGDCNEILRYMEGEFDFVFLDGPKAHYLEMLPKIVELLKSGGEIFADNVLFYGYIEQEGVYNKKKTIIRNMRAYIEELEKNEMLSSKIIEIEDGIAISVKR